MTHEEKCTSSERPWINASDSTPAEDAEKFARQLADIEAKIISPAEAQKMISAIQTFGRVEVVLTRTELSKLFASDVGVIYCEYDQRTEELRICIEGSGLFKNWREGQRPFNVRGKLLDSSYVMLVKDP